LIIGVLISPEDSAFVGQTEVHAIHNLYHYPNKNTLSQCDFTTDDDAYFGEVLIDEKLCTLCMACTSVCPTKALSSGDINTPIINFQESLCVQCGLCVKLT
jgi:ferredoxin